MSNWSFSTQMIPVTTNPGYNEKKMACPELFVITEFDCNWLFLDSFAVIIQFYRLYTIFYFNLHLNCVFN